VTKRKCFHPARPRICRAIMMASLSGRRLSSLPGVSVCAGSRGGQLTLARVGGQSEEGHRRYVVYRNLRGE
jgi:hypothetical protein